MTTLAPPPAPVQDGRHRAAAPPVSRTRRLFLGAPEDPRWARPALWAILLLATALYAWNLTSITGNSFYDAAVYSGTKSGKAFFFGALDAGSFITVDKPPFALWVMGLSARVLGYGTWQLTLPMAAVGVGSVALLYRMVKRDFGVVAATIAALVLTLTPITVAIDRDTNPDPVLVFLMLLGAAALLKAVRNGTLLPLVWSAVAIGFAFNTKMMQTYGVLPAFFWVLATAVGVIGAAHHQPGPAPVGAWAAAVAGGRAAARRAGPGAAQPRAVPAAPAGSPWGSRRPEREAPAPAPAPAPTPAASRSPAGPPEAWAAAARSAPR